MPINKRLIIVFFLGAGQGRWHALVASFKTSASGRSIAVLRNPAGETDPGNSRGRFVANCGQVSRETPYTDEYGTLQRSVSLPVVVRGRTNVLVRR
jgi:hypothetical protein